VPLGGGSGSIADTSAEAASTTVLDELRRFYRLGLQEKLQHIAQAA
jgi:hypothetical protein